MGTGEEVTDRAPEPHGSEVLPTLEYARPRELDAPRWAVHLLTVACLGGVLPLLSMIAGGLGMRRAFVTLLAIEGIAAVVALAAVIVISAAAPRAFDGPGSQWKVILALSAIASPLTSLFLAYLAWSAVRAFQGWAW